MANGFDRNPASRNSRVAGCSSDHDGGDIGRLRLVFVRSTAAGRASGRRDGADDRGRQVSTDGGGGYRPGPAKSIDVVLGQHEPDEGEVWKAAVRSQAGLEKPRLRLFGPPDRRPRKPTWSARLADPRVLLVESTKRSTQRAPGRSKTPRLGGTGCPGRGECRRGKSPHRTGPATMARD